MNYYRRYVGDYLRDTMRLTPVDHGVYDLMLDFYYADERPLPLDHDEIHAICKATKPELHAAVDKVLAAYFTKEADGYHNARADKEIAAARRARENGAMHTGKVTQAPTKQPTQEATEKPTHKATQEGGGSRHPPTTNLQPPETTKSKAEERAARATRLPKDWVLPKAWGEWALTEQPTWTAEHVRKVAENFRDHWIAAPKGTKLDWPATWRKWVRGESALKGNGAAKPWYLTASGVEAKAKELLIEIPSDKRNWPDFKALVYQRAGVTPEMLKAAKQDYEPR